MSWWSLRGLNEEDRTLLLGADDEFNPPADVPWPTEDMMDEIRAALEDGRAVDCWEDTGQVTMWRSFAPLSCLYE